MRSACLVEVIAHVGEGLVEVATNASQRGDRGYSNQGGDKTILDSRSAILIGQQFRKRRHNLISQAGVRDFPTGQSQALMF